MDGDLFGGWVSVNLPASNAQLPNHLQTHKPSDTHEIWRRRPRGAGGRLHRALPRDSGRRPGRARAGAAYVPLDPAYPAERLAYLLRDCGARVLLTLTRLRGLFAGFDGEVVLLDDLSATSSFEAGAGCPPSPVPCPLSLAYVIYTSGSTGLPKGVAVEHRSLVAYAVDMARRLELTPDDRVLQFASPGFDVVVEELFPAWLAGAAVVFPGRRPARARGAGADRRPARGDRLRAADRRTGTSGCGSWPRRGTAPGVRALRDRGWGARPPRAAARVGGAGRAAGARLRPDGDDGDLHHAAAAGGGGWLAVGEPPGGEAHGEHAAVRAGPRRGAGAARSAGRAVRRRARAWRGATWAGRS